MSNLSQFSGGGGGGGETHIKTDPRQLTRMGSRYAQVKNSAADSYYSLQGEFWNSINDFSIHGATVGTAANNTYVTLLNASSANGGYVYWIISPSVSAANTISSIRITVDGGDAYEFHYNYNATYMNVTYGGRMFMGGGYGAFSPSVGTTPIQTYDFWNSYNSYGFTNPASFLLNSSATYDDPTNKVYGSPSQLLTLMSDFAILETMPTERLRFNSSILIEVKQLVLDSQDRNHFGGCFYTLK
jgi:hypothetical protein